MMKAFPLLVSAFLFDHASAVGQDSQFLPRNLLPCGKRGGSAPAKPCSSLIGVGSCKDKDDNSYDFCANRDNIYSLTDCQELAFAAGAIGVEYFEQEPNKFCYILFDNAVTSVQGFACPDGFEAGLFKDGTGSIVTAVSFNGVTKCFACN